MKVTHPADFIITIEVEKAEIDYIDFDLCQQPRETLGHYYDRQRRKPNILMNGGFFSMKDGSTNFSFIDDGEIIKLHDVVTAGFGIMADGSLKFGDIKDKTKWKDFIAGYPVLVRNSFPVHHFPYANEINYNAARTAIGVKANGNIIIIGVSSPGCKLEELANLFEAYECTYAINLDGGGSSRIVVDGKVANKPKENRSVDTVVAIYLKTSRPEEKPEEVRPYISYTVQKGDSLWKITAEYLGNGARYKEIVAFNNLKTNSLKVGQVLKIAVDSEKYTVKAGDSLWSIAASKLGNGARYKEIMKFNNMTSSTIRPGQVIYIPM